MKPVPTSLPDAPPPKIELTACVRVVMFTTAGATTMAIIDPRSRWTAGSLIDMGFTSVGGPHDPSIRLNGRQVGANRDQPKSSLRALTSQPIPSLLSARLQASAAGCPPVGTRRR